MDSLGTQLILTLRYTKVASGVLLVLKGGSNSKKGAVICTIGEKDLVSILAASFCYCSFSRMRKLCCIPQKGSSILKIYKATKTSHCHIYCFSRKWQTFQGRRVWFMSLVSRDWWMENPYRCSLASLKSVIHKWHSIFFFSPSIFVGNHNHSM